MEELELGKDDYIWGAIVSVPRTKSLITRSVNKLFRVDVDNTDNNKSLESSHQVNNQK